MITSAWTTDELGAAIRSLVRVVMDLPENTVRPANQLAPTGDQVTEFATVNVIMTDPIGQPSRAVDQTDPDDELSTVEAIEVPIKVVASVNFYRSPIADPTGAARHSSAAFDRAVQFGQRLHLSSSIETMARMGLCLTDVSGARNIPAVVDANWESRGQLDVTFQVIARTTAPIRTITTVPLTTQAQSPGDDIDTTTTEVTS